jgi:hypothetical protein
MANVFLSLVHKLGLDEVTSIGDSTGEFELNAVTGATEAE